MSRVFTVYFCGTSFSRERTEELIANLATITAGMEARPGNYSMHDAWMIHDGPGAVGKVAGSGVRTPGSGPFKVLRGRVLGHGWEQNVAASMDAIRFGMKSKPITVVNMAGWSRGAVTCHMLAHALAKDPQTSRIEVNIFAVDPVAGPGNRSDADKNTLPGNVRRYLCVQSEHESRAIMKPVNVDLMYEQAAEGCKVRILRIPGEHNTGVLQGTPAGKLIWGLAHKFLTKHGTKLTKIIDHRPVDICELYAGIRYYMPLFQAMKGTSGRFLGTAARNLKNEFLNHHYWVNTHHLHQFLKAFPGVARLITNPNLLANEGMFDEELKKIGKSAPWTYTSMRKLGLMA